MNKNKAKYNLYFPGFAGTELFVLLLPYSKLKKETRTVRK